MPQMSERDDVCDACSCSSRHETMKDEPKDQGSPLTIAEQKDVEGWILDSITESWIQN